MVRGERLQKRAGPRPQVVLGDHVRGRPELPGQLDRVAPSDLQSSVLVDAGSDRVHVRELICSDRHARPIMPCGMA